MKLLELGVIQLCSELSFKVLHVNVVEIFISESDCHSYAELALRPADPASHFHDRCASQFSSLFSKSRTRIGIFLTSHS